LQRAAILSNEKYRGVKLDVSPGQLRISAHNPEQEEAVEEIEAETSVDHLKRRFQRELPAGCAERAARTRARACGCACATPTPVGLVREAGQRRRSSAATW
jgi:hypothetical protein